MSSGWGWPKGRRRKESGHLEHWIAIRLDDVMMKAIEEKGEVRSESIRLLLSQALWSFPLIKASLSQLKGLPLWAERRNGKWVTSENHP